LGWQQRPCIPPSAWRELRTLAQRVRLNEPTVVTIHPSFKELSGSPHVVICSDATPYSFGGVCLQAGHEPAAFGARFESDVSNIAVAEAVALYSALLAFAHVVESKRVLFLIDNTAALAVLHKTPDDRCTAHLPLRCVTTQIHALLLQLHVEAAFAYISTHTNPADAPSRAKPIDMTSVANLQDCIWPSSRTHT